MALEAQPAAPVAEGGDPEGGVEVEEEAGAAGEDTSQARDQARQAAADSIKPGCTQFTLAGWKPGGDKPLKKHLQVAMDKRTHTHVRRLIEKGGAMAVSRA